MIDQPQPFPDKAPLQGIRFAFADIGNLPDGPDPIRIVDIPCFHCRRTTRFLAPDIVSKEVDFWRDRYERLLGSLNDAVKECQTVFGDDPMRQKFVRDLLAIRALINQPKEESDG